MNNLKKKIFLPLLMLLCCSMMLLSSCFKGSQITRENYEKIHTGMSRSEVLAILGNDYEVDASVSIEGYTGSSYIWTNAFGDTISITFINGEVYMKAQSGL